MAAKLHNLNRGTDHALGRGLKYTIGRSVDADIQVLDPGAARKHAFLEQDPAGRWTITDSKSTGGTWIEARGNARRIITHVLDCGDVVILGQTRLRFLDDGLAADDENSAPGLEAAIRRELAGATTPYRAQWLTEQLDRRGGEVSGVLRAAANAPGAGKLAAAGVLGQLCRSPRLEHRPLAELAALTCDLDAAVRREAVLQLAAAIGAPEEPLLAALTDREPQVFRAALDAVRIRQVDLGRVLEALGACSPARREEAERALSWHRPR